jgi:hypothetical protein
MAVQPLFAAQSAKKNALLHLKILAPSDESTSPESDPAIFQKFAELAERLEHLCALCVLL